MNRPAIYVDIVIDAPMADLWERTQNPTLHEQWDLRFSKITYLPKSSSDEPQRFTYETKMGFGITVAGTGESVGTHESEWERTSALQFASDDPKAIIRKGSGYWKYIEQRDTGCIRFLTLYNYHTRFGMVGTLFDRVIFRPLLGWATAWSFDRLRLWLERGIDPQLSAVRSLVHAMCRCALAIIWMWHGLVPKIIARHDSELAFLREAGLFEGREVEVTIAAGVFEFIIGLLHLILWRVRWLYIFDAAVFATLGIGAVITIPVVALPAFNPVSLTISIVTLAIVGWIACRDLPSARRCLRTAPDRAKEAA